MLGEHGYKLVVKTSEAFYGLVSGVEILNLEDLGAAK